MTKEKLFCSVDQKLKDHSCVSRRRFLSACVGLGAGLFASSTFATLGRRNERRLSFYNTHTGEQLTTCYWSKGKYLVYALTDLDRILRDHRSGDIYPIERSLLDVLYALQLKVARSGAFHVLSGYRSPATNAMLRKRLNGVAKYSLHVVGQAVDIRLPGCELKHLRRAARALRAGGVGYYPGSNFIHVDVGEVRSW